MGACAQVFPNPFSLLVLETGNARLPALSVEGIEKQEGTVWKRPGKSFLFRPWMGEVVHCRQMLEVQSGINLGGGDGRMSQHFLYSAQIAGRLQNVRSE